MNVEEKFCRAVKNRKKQARSPPRASISCVENRDELIDPVVSLIDGGSGCRQFGVPLLVALSFELLEHVVVDAKMHRCFAARHDLLGALPEVSADRRALGRVGAGFARPASNLPFDRAK